MLCTHPPSQRSLPGLEVFGMQERKEGGEGGEGGHKMGTCAGGRTKAFGVPSQSLVWEAEKWGVECPCF